MNKVNIKKLLNSIDKISIRSAKHYFCRAPLFGRRHKHKDIYHITYVIQGKSEVVIDSKKHKINPTSLLYVPPGHFHISLNDEDTDYELIEIKFTIDVRNPSSIILQEPFHLNVHNPAGIEVALDRVVRAGIFKLDEEKIIEKIRLIESLILIFNEKTKQLRTELIPTGLEMKIREAIEYISLNYTKFITVEELAELVGLSESYFTSCFKKIAGSSPIEYVLQMRINHSKELLMETDWSVGQIASACGFSSSQYFARLFKKKTGLTPTMFRISKTNHNRGK